MYNSRAIYQSVYSDMAGFCESLPVPARHNSKYGTEDMRQSMMLAATRNGNVAACLMAQQDAGVPSPEWFRLGTDRMSGNVPQDFFRRSIIKQLGMMKSLVWMPKEGLDIAADMHKIPRCGHKHGPELTRSRSRKGIDLRDTSRHSVSDAPRPCRPAHETCGCCCRIRA